MSGEPPAAVSTKLKQKNRRNLRLEIDRDFSKSCCHPLQAELQSASISFGDVTQRPTPRFILLLT